jgi:BMFP domain-containing protein YqiC
MGRASVKQVANKVRPRLPLDDLGEKRNPMQTDNRFLDGMAKFLTNAAGAAQAFKAEMETMMKSRLERMISDLEFVPRDEFDAVKAMAAKARAENEKLAARLAELEARVGGGKPKGKSSRRPRKA